MADSIHIALSPYQLVRFAQFDAETRALNVRVSDTVTAIVAGQVDPATLAGWDIRLDGASICCTPPEQAPENTENTAASDAKLQLVPDIGPDGVSDAAAVS